MISAIVISLAALAGMGSALYLLFHKRAGAYATIFYVAIPAIFIFPYTGIFQYPPSWIYFGSALTLPVLTFFLFFGKARLAPTVLYTINLSALLVIVYAFWLAQYFFNYYMGPPFAQGEAPSLIISQCWVYAFLWSVLPFDAIYALMYLSRRYR